MQALVKTSYKREDVIILLKDLSSEMKEMSTEEREKAIQSGTHYSEMLPQEKEPTIEYENLYEKALKDKKCDIALGIATVSEIMLKNTKGETPIIISLARAGIPVGILMKRYIKMKYNMDVPHYAISIIRDKGIDINAMNYIYEQHRYINVENFIFVDGWTGKGAIKTQLSEAVQELKETDEKWKDLKDDLYVLADPANITPFRGTKADFLLPSACLNSTVSGLTSRTILNQYIDVKKGEFHGAVYFKKFESIDKSNDFIDIITEEFHNINPSRFLRMKEDVLDGETGMITVNDICEKFNVTDFKKVKPGIGEATRVLLRRVPWKVLINTSLDDPDIQHILELCKEKNIPYETYPMGNYKVCGIIKELSADA